MRSSLIPARESQIEIRASQSEVVPQTTKESFFRLARCQSHVVAVGEEGCHTADLVQPQLLSNTGESAYMISLCATNSNDREVYLPTENGALGAESFTSSGLDVHRSGMKLLPMGNVRGSITRLATQFQRQGCVDQHLPRVSVYVGVITIVLPGINLSPIWIP